MSCRWTCLFCWRGGRIEGEAAQQVETKLLVELTGRPWAHLAVSVCKLVLSLQDRNQNPVQKKKEKPVRSSVRPNDPSINLHLTNASGLFGQPGLPQELFQVINGYINYTSNPAKNSFKERFPGNRTGPQVKVVFETA